MSKIKKAAKDALARGRDAAIRVGKVAKSTTVVAAKAGAAAAVDAGSRELDKRWKASHPDQVKKRRKAKVLGVIAGTAALVAASMAVGRARAKESTPARKPARG